MSTAMPSAEAESTRRWEPSPSLQKIHRNMRNGRLHSPHKYHYRSSAILSGGGVTWLTGLGEIREVVSSGRPSELRQRVRGQRIGLRRSSSIYRLSFPCTLDDECRKRDRFPAMYSPHCSLADQAEIASVWMSKRRACLRDVGLPVLEGSRAARTRRPKRTGGLTPSASEAMGIALGSCQPCTR